MFVFLSKKISLPNNAKINCVQWNSENDWIAVGGEDGFLKILQLESSKIVTRSSPGSNLTMNQTLEGHSGHVRIIAWNEQHQKLTSSDDNGVIIVWTLHRGTWYEEMINNRNKSMVKGIVWNHDGCKICIVYEDGAVIVGSVDGSRIWGKELKKLGLTSVQWSPDSKHLLFALRNGELHLYNDEGFFSMKLKILCLPPIQIIIFVAGVHWYDGRNGYFSDNAPVLAVAFQSGHIQLMRSPHDEDPIILDTSMFIAKCKWNHNGSVLAVIGTTILVGENASTNVIQFFTPFGEHIRTLKLPGSAVSDFSWERNSLRIAIAIDSHLYFANIRPSYTWCYFSDTVVFSTKSNDKQDVLITFWNTKTNQCYQKIVKSLFSVAACKDHCVLAVQSDAFAAQYSLMICNSLTSVIDCKTMDLKPLWVSMNSTHVFAASKENFIMWHYSVPKSHTPENSDGARLKKERLYHVDDTPSGVAEVIQDLDENFVESTRLEPTKDPICCMTCSEKTLLIGRKSGTVQRYALPQVALIQRLLLSSRPQSIAVNCNCSKMSVIDCTGTLSLITLRKDIKENCGISKEERGNCDRRDIWDMKWAADNSSYLAVMEKTRMYVLKDGSPEEPISSSAYIADFQNLEIKGVLLDELIFSPNAVSSNYFLNFEVKSLRDTRELLQMVGIAEATAFIEKNPHPRLWRLLAEAALQNMDLSTAEMAYVRRNDYAGVQLIKRLTNLPNNNLKKALLESYLGNFDEAEKLYLKSDRRDLAIALRERLGDWFRTVELMKIGTVASDSQLISAWNNIGEYFMDCLKWDTAKEYFLKAGNYEKLISCYHFMEDYEGLERCMSMLPEKDPLLEKLGEIFFNVGMCTQAVDAYSKFGVLQSAIDVCIKLNQWDMAFQLTGKSSSNSLVSQMFEKHVGQLMRKNRVLDAVQLYRKAEKYFEAADLLFEIAKQRKFQNTTPLLLKKIYVLIGLLVQNHLASHKNERSKAAAAHSKASTGVNLDSIHNTKLLDDPWHHAEAYHFLMLSQYQLIHGNIETALRTCIILRNYDDVLNRRQIYCIIAVCAISCQAYQTASKAFTELETLQMNSKIDVENIALHLFSKHEPEDPRDKYSVCSSCSNMIPLWDLKCERCNTKRIICIGTGRYIDSINDAWQCSVCKHFILYSHMMSRNVCPLCHAPTKL